MSPEHLYLNPKKRREIIRDNILFHTYEDIASKCGVSKRTIIRDINKWKSEGGFDQFLIKEFFELYSLEKRENPSRALDRVIMLMTKRMENRPELDYSTITLKWQQNEPDSNDKVQSTQGTS